jgi:hypothetical protein
MKHLAINGRDTPGGRARAFASDGEMIRDGRAIPHSATTATSAMRLLRYLRRPAARKIVSSDTSGSLDSLSFALTRRQRAAFGSVAWSGTPLG